MSKQVIVIDDSLTVRKILEVALRREGVDVVTYSDGIEALRTIKAQPDLTPAVIFLDICMPQMDGYTVLRLLRTSPRFDATLIVMLSHRNGVLDRLKGRLAGATVYMTKPFKTQDILSVVLPHVQTVPTSSRARKQETISNGEPNRETSQLDFTTSSYNIEKLRSNIPEYVKYLA
ncbi:MAG: PleD family two-component system response regulator [Ktedonobacteraceae bacterium]